MIRKSVLIATALVAVVGGILGLRSISPVRPDPLAGTNAAAGPDPLAEAIADAWMHDGRRGYYSRPAVDGPPPVSLYETYWRIRLWNPATDGPLHLVPARVRTWLDPATRGAQPNSVRPLTQVAYATETARKLGLPLDKAAALAAIGKLRVGDRYRSSPSTAPTWGSTAVAVRTLVALGAAPDRAIRAAAEAELGRLPRKPTLEAVVDRVAPVLEILSRTGDSTPVPAAEEHRARAVTTLLGAGFDPVVLATLEQLHGAAEAPMASSWCSQAAQRIQATEAEEGRPDLVSIGSLRDLGCAAVSVPPMGAYSRAGWQDQASAIDAIGATAQVLYYLGAAGRTPEKAGMLRETLSEVWLPAARKLDLSASADLTYLVRLCAIATSLGERSAVAVTWRRAPGNAGDALNRALSLTSPAGGGGPAGKQSVRALAEQLAAFEQTSPILTAAGYEIASRSLADPALHAKAVTLVNGRLIKPGVYGLADRTAPSLTASIIANWIVGDLDRPVDALVAAGLCTGDRRCAESAAVMPQARPDFTGYLLTTLCARRACGADYPLIL